MDVLIGFLMCLFILLIVYSIYELEKKVSNSRSKNNEKTNHKYIAWIVILIGIMSPIVTYILSTNDKLRLAAAGGVGDWLAGSSVPFLTFGAFLVAYFTFTSQKEELRLTRIEYNRQTDTLNIQRFENTFFIMLREIKQFHDVNRMKTVIGRERDSYDDILNAIKRSCNITKSDLEEELKKYSGLSVNVDNILHTFRLNRYVKGIYELGYNLLSQNNFFGLYHYTNKIFELIKNHELTNDEAFFYVDFLRLYLSKEAMVSMIYYSLTEYPEESSNFFNFQNFGFFSETLSKDYSVDDGDYRFLNYIAENKLEIDTP